MHHQYQRHRQQIATSMKDTGGKFATVSMTPMTNNGNNSDSWHLRVNLKKNKYLYVNSATQRYPNKYLKLFWLKVFFTCHQCRRTRGLGETDSWKNLNSKISWHCPFKCSFYNLLSMHSSFSIKGQIAFILAFVLFQLVFWSVALAEYFSEWVIVIE